ncbi:hypothetical protein T10_11669 [Trichinella papuae]|uniref:MULE transposase domain-containing protein n=1 Tax=Trichinella papuae TaxID=268474 RepID=A0A0V1N1R5_9BILA|nr:hypothetical protein T10_11669 [Trichinella papuae]
MEKKAVLKKRSAEETKPIPAIYDEEAFAASAQPSTSGHFPLFKREKFTMYNHRTKRYPKLPQHRRDLQIPVNLSGQRRPVMNFCCGRVHRGTYWYLLRVPTLDCWHPCEPGAWMVVPQWYQQLFTIHTFAVGKLVSAVDGLCTSKDIGTYRFLFQALITRAAALEVNINPDTNICDLIHGYFPNARVQGCYFHFCQAVHRKVGELGLKTRYRTEEEKRLECSWPPLSSLYRKFIQMLAL